ncbi:hypothetical protein SRHO_G00089530 [Serrasalmus rhombeus]
MAGFPLFTERYLLTLIYSTVSDHPHAASVTDLCYDTHTAVVLVTNTGDRPLSSCNLECLALSIPELNHRIMGYRHAPMLLYPILVWVEILHWDCSNPLRSRVQLPSGSQTRSRPQTAHQSQTAAPAAKLTQHPLLAPSESHSCLTADWLMCDCSFTTASSPEEWTTVTYRDQDFIRSLCPVYYTDDDVDIRGRCSVSDYTAYGQLVFSVHIDFLCEDRLAVSEPSSDSKQEC